jgi:leader peptidase (prepilin peptidase)/N-methyltransferase
VILFVGLIGLLGLLVGSFLNVVVWRVPRGESITHPPSHCPACGRPIRPRDNVPVLSWVLLRGRCRDCGARISARYPLVEVLTAAMFVLMAVVIEPVAAVPAFLYLAAVGVALALIDIDVKRLPNSIVLPSYVVGIVLLTAAALTDGDPGRMVQALGGMALLYAFYFTLALVYPAGMGFGDVKLAGVLGLYLGWLGWGSVVVGAFLGFFTGGLLGGLLLASGRATRKSAIPFGPFMLVGALLGIIWGEPLTDAYLTHLGVGTR